MRTVKEKIEILLRGVEEVIPRKDFISLIEKKQKLTIKAGFDPTSPDLHLGHTVLINKLKQFQDLGHKVIFLICLLYTSPSPRDTDKSRMPSSA